MIIKGLIFCNDLLASVCEQKHYCVVSIVKECLSPCICIKTLPSFSWQTCDLLDHNLYVKKVL